MNVQPWLLLLSVQKLHVPVKLHVSFRNNLGFSSTNPCESVVHANLHLHEWENYNIDLLIIRTWKERDNLIYFLRFQFKRL